MAGNKKSFFDSSSGESKQTARTLSILLVRYFNLLIIAIVIFIFAGGYWYVIKPKYKKIALEAQSVNLERENEQADLERYYSRLRRYQTDYSSLAVANREKISIILPDITSEEKLFAQLEALIAKQGLLLTGLQITSASDVKKKEAGNLKEQKTDTAAAGLPAGVEKAKIKLDIIGTDYKSFKKLIATIESNLHILDIRNLTFSPENKAVALEVETYYLRPEEAVKAAKVEVKKLDIEIFDNNKFSSLKDNVVDLLEIGDMNIGNKNPFSPD